MVKKCCVVKCKTNYTSEKRKKNIDVGNNSNYKQQQENQQENVEEKVPVYRFPKNQEEREKWRKVIPNANLKVTDDTVVCELHWPHDFEKISKNGKVRPKHPPSVWPKEIPDSQIPAMLPAPRKTKKSLSSERNLQRDELAKFLASDKVTYIEMKENILTQKRNFAFPVIAYLLDNTIHIQSQKFLNGVPLFLVKIFDTLRFETFHAGVKCFVSSLTKNRITDLDSWSKIDEVIRYLHFLELDHKKSLIQEELTAMGPVSVGKPIYSHQIIIRAFEYFATARCLYNLLRKDYQLPSIKTLTRITSKVSKLSESSFLNKVFDSVDNENQKLCLIIHDEVYVKKMMLYHGGRLFGKAVDDPLSLAKTVLGIMIVCLHGGPVFLSKMLPIAKLKSDFLREQIDASVQSINLYGGSVKAVICDGNRVNQSFFKSFKIVPGKPWLADNGTFLLFDYVHLLKNIRNNWLTEPMGELQFEDNGVKRIAKWSHLKKLFLLESTSLVKMSTLTEVSVSPKPIEKQKVLTCLNVFSDKTYNALLCHPGMADEDTKDTAIFIKKVLTWWKIMNVKGTGADVRHRDPLEEVIRDPSDYRLNILQEFGDMALKMAGKQGKRFKQLTKDTGKAIYHTCYGVVELCRFLLGTTHQYVILSKFSSDILEKEFGKLRQGSGGTYFITVQQILEKLVIKKTSILLSLDINPSELNFEPGHECTLCGYLLDEEGSEIFDNLPELEDSIPLETKMSLVYITGYVTRKDKELDEDLLFNQTTFYHQKYGSYTDRLDRGGLNIPSDCACQWSFFSFVIFKVVKDKVCRKSLCNLMMLVSEFYSFGMEKHHGRILANIFLKNFCKSLTPRSIKEPSLKILKLS